MVPYSARNLIEYTVPNLLWQDGGFLSLPHEESKAPSRNSVLTKLMNIWSTDWIEKSLAEESKLHILDTLHVLNPRFSHNLIFLPAATGLDVKRRASDIGIITLVS